MDIDLLLRILGWSSVLNIAVLLLSTAILFGSRGRIIAMHARLFNADEKALPGIYLNFLGNYKILIIFFNIVPYFALRIAT